MTEELKISELPPGSDMAVLRFFRQPAGSFNAGNWLASCIA